MDKFRNAGSLCCLWGYLSSISHIVIILRRCNSILGRSLILSSFVFEDLLFFLVIHNMLIGCMMMLLRHELLLLWLLSQAFLEPKFLLLRCLLILLLSWLVHCFVFGLFCFLTRILLLQCFLSDLLWHFLSWLLDRFPGHSTIILVCLQLLHAKSHYILHLVKHFEVDIFVIFRSVYLAQNALFANMLPTLKLKEFGYTSTFADIGPFMTARLLVMLLRLLVSFELLVLGSREHLAQCSCFLVLLHEFGCLLNLLLSFVLGFNCLGPV